MSRRGENIHKRKDGRWEGRYKRGRKSDGHIEYGSVYGKTYREVKDKLSRTIIENTETILSGKKDCYFKDILELWIENNRLRLKGASVAKYQNLIDTHILPEMGNIKLSRIDATLINTFLADKMQHGRLDKKGGLSPAYVRSIMLVINASLKFAVNEQMISPLKTSISKPVIIQKELSILSREEQKRLEMYLTSELDSTRLGILISLHTGLRIGEICALSWENVDMHNHLIRVRHTIARIKSTNPDCGGSTVLIVDSPKTKASIRDIPITRPLLSMLAQIKSKSHSPYVISETDNFISPRTYDYRYHRILEECGINSVNYHTLRHTFATRCIEAGVDVKSLSEILGHANVGVTLNTYVHSSMDMKRSQLEKLTILSA